MHLQKQLREQISLKGVYIFTIRDAATGKIKRIHHYENIVPTVGRALIAETLTNPSPSSSMLASYMALGTGAATPANGDTRLQTETYRNAVASRTNADNVAYLTAFFDATEVSGTFNEAGIFCGGTASADSGVLLSHVAINVVKSNTETLTIDWTLTIN
jgi:hypothetical protein